MAVEPIECKEKRQSCVCKLDDEGTMEKEQAGRRAFKGVMRPQTHNQHPQEPRASSWELETGARRQRRALRIRS